MKYRKRPIEVEAFHWQAEKEDSRVFPQWLKEAMAKPGYKTGAVTRLENVAGNIFGLSILTLEGMPMVRDGDYIIQGVKGELYPCREDIFLETYERVEDEEKPDDYPIPRALYSCMNEGCADERSWAADELRWAVFGDGEEGWLCNQCRDECYDVDFKGEPHAPEWGPPDAETVVKDGPFLSEVLEARARHGTGKDGGPELINESIAQAAVLGDEAEVARLADVLHETQKRDVDDLAKEMAEHFTQKRKDHED